MKTIAFFNNKAGVGKTSLVYHLAWMYADMGLRVLAADLDPQANLSSMFLDEDRLEQLWPDQGQSRTVLGAILPLLEGEGGIQQPHVEEIEDLGLLVGDLGLSSFEDELSVQWPRCLEEGSNKRAFRVTAAFYEVLRKASDARDADIVLIDVGPNLGSINRAALVATNSVAIPLAPDLYSLKGLQNLGPTLRAWRRGWQERLSKKPENMHLPEGSMSPIGYIVMQHAVRLDRPVKAYDQWIARIPQVYHRSVLESPKLNWPSVEADDACLSTIKHYRSLMPMAMEARRPMFALRPADGAIGAHVKAVQNCYDDFHRLAVAIAKILHLDDACFAVQM
ncbi:MAG: ParA family protein [Gammaproteobacteria bacterium]